MILKKLLFVIVLLFSFIFLACNLEENNDVSNYVDIKYRDDSIDISHSRWEYLDTSKSSFIEGAWYDKQENYMIIDLSGTKYHYCSMPESTWNRFKKADSFGVDYNVYIKGEFDCRENAIPHY